MLVLVGLLGLLGANLRSNRPPSVFAAAEGASPAVQALLDRGIIGGYSDGPYGADVPLTREEEIVLLARFHAYLLFHLALKETGVRFEDVFDDARLRLEGKLLLEADTEAEQLQALTPPPLTLPPEYEVPRDHWAYPAACYLTIERERNWKGENLLPLRGLTRQQAAEAIHELILKLEATPLGQQPSQPEPQEEEIPSVAPEQEAEALILKLTEGKPFGEWGDPEAPTKVFGYIPDSPCHNECVQFLVDKAEESASELYVRLVRMFTPEGMKIMTEEGRQICATYEINGRNTLTITTPDGSTKEVTFKMSPEAGNYTVEDLKAAVEQAIQQASNQQR